MLKVRLLIVLLWAGLMFSVVAFANVRITEDVLNQIKRKCGESYPQEYLIKYTMDNITITTPLQYLTDVFSTYLKPGIKFVI